MSASAAMKPQPPAVRRSHHHAGSGRSATNTPTRASRFARSESKASRSSRSSLGGSRRGFSRQGTDGGDLEDKPPLQLLDADGNDMTPRSLLAPGRSNQTPGPTARRRTGFAIGSEWAGSQRSNASGSRQGAGSLTQSKLLSASAFGVPFSQTQLSESDGSSTKSLQLGSTGMDAETPDADASAPAASLEQRASRAELLSDEDLVTPVTLHLTETETIWMLDLPGTWVAPDSPEADAVAAANARYEEVVKHHISARDNYGERPAQTLGGASKHKAVQFAGPATASAGCQTSTADIHDTNAALQAALGRGQGPALALSAAAAPGGLDLAVDFDGPGEGGDSPARAAQAYSDPATVLSEPAEPPTAEKVLASETLQQSLKTVERLVAHGIHGDQQHLYKAPADAPAEPAGTPPQVAVKPLWNFTCGATDGRTITCMQWNPSNPDILAVGYGSLSFGAQDSGLICCWSLKNPEFPERTFALPTGCVSLAFSLQLPNLLAAGWYDGTVALFDIHDPSKTEPVIDSREHLPAAKHSEAVWALRWVERQTIVGDAEEVLVSASTDGRVLQWSIAKGLEATQLMHVPRVAQPSASSGSSGAKGKGGAKTALLARHAGVLALDFTEPDTNTYLVGTENGLIHKCSCSYAEQFVSSFRGHQGPVYRLRCSPHAPGVFMSCSNDWSIRLWSLEEPAQASVTLQTAGTPVLDARWSPSLPTVLGSISSTTLSLWDLSVKALDPLFTMELCGAPEESEEEGEGGGEGPPARPAVELTQLEFASGSNIVVTGDTSGRVTVSRLENVGAGSTVAEQLAQLSKLVPTSS